MWHMHVHTPTWDHPAARTLIVILYPGSTSSHPRNLRPVRCAGSFPFRGMLPPGMHTCTRVGIPTRYRPRHPAALPPLSLPLFPPFPSLKLCIPGTIEFQGLNFGEKHMQIFHLLVVTRVRSIGTNAKYLHRCHRKTIPARKRKTICQ